MYTTCGAEFGDRYEVALAKLEEEEQKKKPEGIMPIKLVNDTAATEFEEALAEMKRRDAKEAAQTAAATEHVKAELKVGTPKLPDIKADSPITGLTPKPDGAMEQQDVNPQQVVDDRKSDGKPTGGRDETAGSQAIATASDVFQKPPTTGSHVGGSRTKSWANFAAPDPLQPCPANGMYDIRSTGYFYQRKDAATGAVLVKVDKQHLLRLSRFAFDPSIKWPSQRKRDTSRLPQFTESELTKYLMTCSKINVNILSLEHAKLTYDPRLLDDSAVYEQWMEDHGFYHACGWSQKHGKGYAQRDHRWPCSCSNHGTRMMRYTCIENGPDFDRDKSCKFAVRCNKLSTRAREFFRFCHQTGLASAPPIEQSRARAADCKILPDQRSRQGKQPAATLPQPAGPNASNSIRPGMSSVGSGPATASAANATTPTTGETSRLPSHPRKREPLSL